jgi:AcrR family transcriptional regulator
MPKISAKKEDWIKLGYKQFSDKGISGIVIEKMSKKLNVNKSSFYWHFSTKKVFLQQIIDYWVKESTSKIISQVNQMPTPTEKFEKLIELSFLKDNNIDFFFYLKKYAKTNKELNDLIDSLDGDRIHFTDSLLIELGFSKEDARVKSSIFYKYLIGYHEMIRYKNQSSDYMTEVKKELNQFITF